MVLLGVLSSYLRYPEAGSRILQNPCGWVWSGPRLPQGAHVVCDLASRRLGMNQGLLNSLTEAERMLVAGTERDVLKGLDEDELLDLHQRIRRGGAEEEREDRPGGRELRRCRSGWARDVVRQEPARSGQGGAVRVCPRES